MNRKNFARELDHDSSSYLSALKFPFLRSYPQLASRMIGTGDGAGSTLKLAADHCNGILLE